VAVCFSETFEALCEGLQGALGQRGAVPTEHRTDNLSAVTRELRLSRSRGFTARDQERLGHDGLKASKTPRTGAREW
jgi:hypothetical protein